MKPLCFVLMPFGRKPGSGGRVIDFDAVYRDLIAPAVEKAGMKPLRADQEQQGGIVHKSVLERLILCEYAVADLSTAAASVFYGLGLRHAIRGPSTVLIFAEGSGQLPFDVGSLRFPYPLGADGKPRNAKRASDGITKLLRAARKQTTESPLFQLVENFPDIQRLKTDVFRDRVEYSEKVKAKLAKARDDKDAAAVHAVQASLGGLHDADPGVLVDLLLSYRATSDWAAMLALAAVMPEELAVTVLVQEQLGFALNRAGKGKQAERVLRAVLDRRGPSSETYGLLGRVYKDRWEAEQKKSGDTPKSRGMLDQAIDAYYQGFNADIRDAYPGINAVTLMEIRDPPDPRRLELLPVVTHAVKMRMEGGKPDYWDYATRLELAVLRKDEADAAATASQALARVREPFEPGTTARNLRLIREARGKRRETVRWAKAIEDELAKRSAT